jgi:hypothetical protein
MWAWGTCAADFNNDGWLDLFVVNGFGVWPQFSGLTDKQSTFLAQMGLSPLFQNTSPRLFINNGDGTFSEKAAAWHVDMPLNGRGIACFDYDRDGDVDVAALDQSVGIKFFENHSGDGDGHHFINLRLVGDRPNTDSLGARVFVTADLDGNGRIEAGETQMRVSLANSNFNSQNLPDLHFGLRKASTVKDIKVVWPDGRTRLYRNLPANQFLILREAPVSASAPSSTAAQARSHHALFSARGLDIHSRTAARPAGAGARPSASAAAGGKFPGPVTRTGTS